MRTLCKVALLLVLFASPAFAKQVSEWRSTSGSTITMSGTENMQFQIIINTPQGQSMVYDAYWVEVRNLFRYSAQGINYNCTYTNKGWSIVANGGPGHQYRWDFVRWISH